MSNSATGSTWWGEWVVLRKEYTFEFDTTIHYAVELESNWNKFFSRDGKVGGSVTLIEKCLTKAEAEALAEFLNHASEVMEEDCG